MDQTTQAQQSEILLGYLESKTTAMAPDGLLRVEPVQVVGRIEEGAPADFLVFANDPTRSLDALDSLFAIAAGGRLYRSSDLYSSVDEYRAFYQRWLVDHLSIRVAKAKLANTTKSDE